MTLYGFLYASDTCATTCLQFMRTHIRHCEKICIQFWHCFSI